MVMNSMIGMEIFYLFSVRYVHGTLPTCGAGVALLYGNRIEAQIVYRDKLDCLAAETPTHVTHVTHVLGEPPEAWDGAVGLIDGAAIARAFDPFPGASRWHYLLCGPPPMIAAAEAALKARGIPRVQVSAERFRYD